ncbi:hypothetical protein GCM10027065_23230 [Rhodanobacter koreensis]
MNDTAHLTNVFSQQNKCYRAWNDLVSNWEKNGGGFKESLLSTRNQISADRHSVFSKIVRDVWSVQSGKKSRIGRFGQWPISAADMTLVVRDSNESISKTLDQYLPHGCGAFTWLYPVIWDKSHAVIGAKVQVVHFAEMPSGMIWDSYSTPRWVLYWLFIRAN